MRKKIQAQSSDGQQYSKWRRKPVFITEVISRTILPIFHTVLKTKDAEFRYNINTFQKHSNTGRGFSYDTALIYDTSSVSKTGVTPENHMLEQDFSQRKRQFR